MAACTSTASATSRSVPNAKRKRKRSSIRKRSPLRKSRTRPYPLARNRRTRNRTLRNRKEKNRKKRSRKKSPSRQLWRVPPGVPSEGDFLLPQTRLLLGTPLLPSCRSCSIPSIGHRRDHACEDFHARGQCHR